jgi:nucleotide-binding universal stress UspA family protein
MGTHSRRGFNHLLMGSDAESVLRVSSIPVLLVKPDQQA